MGTLYRRAKLSVIAGEDCGLACLLWLLGGVSRTVVSDLEVDMTGMNAEAFGHYSRRMGLAKTLARSLVESDGTHIITVAEFERLIGEQPESFGRWMVEHCGEQKPEEREDLRLVQALGFVEMLRKLRESDPSRSDLESIILKYENLASGAEQFDEVYRQRLLDQ